MNVGILNIETIVYLDNEPKEEDFVLDFKTIKVKALALMQDLKLYDKYKNCQFPNFSASRQWFARFRNKCDLDTDYLNSSEGACSDAARFGKHMI